jgi:hypothetical protein
MTNSSPIAPRLVLLGASALSGHAKADAFDSDITKQPTIAVHPEPRATAQPVGVRALRKGNVAAGIITSAAMMACLIGTSACTRRDWGWSEESAASMTSVDGATATSAARNQLDGLAGASRPYTRN